MRYTKIPYEAQNLIISLTEPDRANRLMDEALIASHAWFASINWETLKTSIDIHFENAKLDSLQPLENLEPFADLPYSDDISSVNRDLLYTRFGKLPFFRHPNRRHK